MNTIVFLTGAFVSSHCWDPWKGFFEQRGYRCLAPPWPHKDAPALVLRSRQPDAAIASIRLADLVNYFTDFITQLDEKPILIGHSLGGLLVQLLLQKDLAVAGVAIHSVPPAGVMSFKWSFLRAAWAPLGFFTPASRSFLMSFPQWQYAFANGMPLAEQKAGYEKFAIPESKRALRDGLSHVAKVDYKRPHPPLLFVAGTADHTMPASLNRSNFKRYAKSQSVTEFKLSEGRNHFVLGQPTWREDADFIAQWLDRHV
ncbi:alpha/beta fold hydrolase [Chitinophaga sp. 22620]|uniref:alpha/beta fold hydrolase n=1 Tax=Chitinophaga sp. 22620 TaxID=3453952 RepID=UPI003F8604AA